MDPYMRPSQRRLYTARRPATPAQRALGLVTWLVVAWLLVQCYTKLAHPYWAHWTATSEQYRASLALTTNPASLCAGTGEEHLRLRVELKGHFVECDRAERVVASWPAWTAFGRLLDDFDFCPGGTCMQFRFDTLSSLGLLFMLLAGTLALVLVCAIAMFCRNAYSSLASKHDLPFAAFQVPVKSYPPIATHAYDFNAPMRPKKDD